MKPEKASIYVIHMHMPLAFLFKAAIIRKTINVNHMSVGSIGIHIT